MNSYKIQKKLYPAKTMFLEIAIACKSFSLLIFLFDKTPFKIVLVHAVLEDNNKVLAAIPAASL